MAKNNNFVFRDDVQCFVRSLTYDFKNRMGELQLEDDSCADMSGCIGLFKRIDPGVVAIQTMAGMRRDTVYRLINGKWQAFMSPYHRDPSNR